MVPFATNNNGNVKVSFEVQTHYSVPLSELSVNIGQRLEPDQNGVYQFDVEPDYHLIPGNVTQSAVYINIEDDDIQQNLIALRLRIDDLEPVTIYPIESLGNEYRVITYCQILGSCFLALSTVPNTGPVRVNVTLPTENSMKVQYHKAFYSEGQQIQIQLLDNEALLLECKQCDFTGTLIKSSEKIAVFAGGIDTIVRRGDVESTFLAQMTPVHTWGKDFILVDSNIDDMGDMIRIVPRYRETVVKVSGQTTTRINSTEHYIQGALNRGDIVHVTANKPIMICQILTTGSKQGLMLNVPPTEQYFEYNFNTHCRYNGFAIISGDEDVTNHSEPRIIVDFIDAMEDLKETRVETVDNQLSVENEPETVSKEPENISVETGSQTQEPVGTSEELVNKTQEPVSKSEEPVNNNQELVSEWKEPVSKLEEPENKTQEPVSKLEEPENKTQEPVSKLEEPENKTQEPVSKVEEPSVKQQEKTDDGTEKPKVVKPVKKGMDMTEEWHEDPIPGMGVAADNDSDSSDSRSRHSSGDSDSSDSTRPANRPTSLQTTRKKKKISANFNILKEDYASPDDIDTTDNPGDLEWENDTPVSIPKEPIAEYSAEDEYQDAKHWRGVEINGKQQKIDLKVIDPYKKVLTHGGYYGDGLNAIIVFSGCYLPDRSRKDYNYVMDNLFLYVISTLELLVAEDYMIVYFHGATPRRQMPSFGWLKKCYQMIDRRLKKNLKGLLLIHPTLWLRTIVLMTKPFISSKFSSKLKFMKLKSMTACFSIVPLLTLPLPLLLTLLPEYSTGTVVKSVEELLKKNPNYLDQKETQNGFLVADEEEGKKEKQGEKRQYDPNFKGPIKNRSCTDIICCLLFIVFFTGMIICTVIGYTRGDPYKLILPTDSKGQICGYDAVVKDKPYLMYFDISTCAQMGAAAAVSGCPTPAVCRAACPTSYYVYIETKALALSPGTLTQSDVDKMICKDWATSQPSTGSSSSDIQAFIDDDDCAPYYMDSTGVVNRCVPSIFKTITDYATELYYTDSSGNNRTLKTSSGTEVTGTLMSEASYYLAKFYSAVQHIEMVFKDVVASGYLILIFIGMGTVFAFLSCTTSTFLAIFLFLLLILASRICLAIELIKEGSRAIGNMIFTLFWPIIPFLLQICLLIYMGFSCAYIASMGNSEFYSNSTNVTTNGVDYYLSRTPCTPDSSTAGQFCDFVKYGGEEYIIPVLVFMLFMFLWVMNFIVALGQMTLAGSFASYYWAFEKPKDIPAFPLTAAFYRSLRYHLGTLAFGSLIIAIIQMIRIVLEYLDHKIKGSENPVAKFFLKCLKCCFWCLEKFVKFMNRNAYIMTAIYGRNFCSAAKEAFFLLLRNVVRAVVLDKICDYVLFISKLMVTAAVGVGAYFWFSGGIDFFQKYNPNLNYFLTPVVVVVIGMFIIACTFFSVYNMAVDTLFLCFLEDLEMHDGSPEKPYFMSKSLMKILNKTNKFEEPKGKK
ncbi:SLC44A2_4_5 [Mytilus edulis]|uniref:SLC44A2_4_5 n=1 Tax=Mytilus edulis TaxID=6550 RepID=A0A8S3TRN9_MYTED|nr:SLC44A2_4_5 [Mytilus edulis]